MTFVYSGGGEGKTNGAENSHVILLKDNYVPYLIKMFHREMAD